MSADNEDDQYCAVVVVKKNGSYGGRYELGERKCCFLGTHEHCDIQIKSQAVANIQALVNFKDGKVVILGLHPSIPIVIPNYASLYKGDQCELRDGDSFIISDKHFQISRTEPRRNTSQNSITRYPLRGRTPQPGPRKNRKRRSSLIVTDTEEILVEKNSTENQMNPLSDITDQENDASATNYDISSGLKTPASSKKEAIRAVDTNNEQEFCEDPVGENSQNAVEVSNEITNPDQLLMSLKGPFMATESQTSSVTQVTSGYCGSAVVENSPPNENNRREAIASSSKSAAEKVLTASARSPSARKKLIYERLSQGLPATPLRREPIQKPIHPSPSPSHASASKSATGRTYGKIGRKKIPKPWAKNAANRAKEEKDSQEDLGHQVQSDPSTESEKQAQAEPSRKSDVAGDEVEGSGSSRRKSVNFARYIELGAGPHYSPAPKQIERVGPSSHPASIIRSYQLHPQPSPAANDGGSNQLAERVPGPPPSRSLGILGAFSYPPVSKHVSNSSASPGEDDRPARDLDETTPPAVESSDGGSAKKSAEGFGDFGLSNFWRRISAAQSESDGTDESDATAESGTSQAREEVESSNSGLAAFCDGEPLEQEELTESSNGEVLCDEEDSSEETGSPMSASTEEELTSSDMAHSDAGDSDRNSGSNEYVVSKYSDSDSVNDDEAVEETDDQDSEEHVIHEFANDGGRKTIGFPITLHPDVTEDHVHDDVISTPVAEFYPSSDEDNDNNLSSKNIGADSTDENASNPTLSAEDSEDYSNGTSADSVSCDDSADDMESNSNLSNENSCRFSRDPSTRSASGSSVLSSGESEKDFSEELSESTVGAGEPSSLKAEGKVEGHDIQSKESAGRRTSLIDTVFNAAKAITRRFSAGHETVSVHESENSEIDPEDLETASEHSEDIIYVKDPASCSSRGPCNTESDTTMHGREIETAAALVRLGVDDDGDVTQSTPTKETAAPTEEMTFPAISGICGNSETNSENETIDSDNDDEEPSANSSELESPEGEEEVGTKCVEGANEKLESNPVDATADLIGNVSIKETPDKTEKALAKGSPKTGAPKAQVPRLRIDNIPVDNLWSVTVVDLRKMLRKRGMFSSGNKLDLVERLEAYATDCSRIQECASPETAATKNSDASVETLPLDQTAKDGGPSEGKGKHPVVSHSEHEIDEEIVADRSQYRKKTVKELQVILRQALVKTPGKLRKEELINALIAHNVGPDGNPLKAPVDECAEDEEEASVPEVVKTPRTRTGRVRMMRTPTENIRKSRLHMVEELAIGAEDSVEEEGEKKASKTRSAMSTRSRARLENDEEEEGPKSEQSSKRKAKRGGKERGRRTEKVVAIKEDDRMAGDDSTVSGKEDESGQTGRKSTKKSGKSTRGRRPKGREEAVERVGSAGDDSRGIVTRSSSRGGRSHGMRLRKSQAGNR